MLETHTTSDLWKLLIGILANAGVYTIIQLG